MVQVVKIPKKFADICTLIRDGQPEGTAKLQAYEGLAPQKAAVLAECAYFEGDFARGLALGKEICPHFEQWHYSNVRSEQVAAMAFAARLLSREEEIVRFFAEQIDLCEAAVDVQPHIKKVQITCYQNNIEYIRTGVVPHFTAQETYSPPEHPVSVEEIRATLRERMEAKKDKLKDLDSPEGIYSTFLRCARMGNIADTILLYEQIADAELMHSVDWHITALSCYNHLGDEAKGFGVILRLARERLWSVASPTQVRPMDFFRHPAMFPYLQDGEKMKKIAMAACGKG